MKRGCTPILMAVLAALVLVVAQLACGQPAEEWQLRGWTVTPSQTLMVAQPTQTPVVVQETVVVVAQQTVVVVAQVTPTPANLCVVAQEAVYLRPAPNSDFYPIDPLTNGTEVLLTGSKDGDWVFVIVGVRSGWVKSNWLGDCLS
jgi:hypothetical protein